MIYDEDGLETKTPIDEILTAENVVDLLSEDDLQTMGVELRASIEADLDSRRDWEDNIDEWIKLATQVVDEKSFPWPGASNVKYPLLATAATQYAARAYSALLPGVNLVKGRVVGFDPDGSKRSRAIRIEKHMSYQLLEEMPEWEGDMDRLMHVLPIVGTAFKKTYHNPLLQRHVSELVLPKDLVVNYHAKNLQSAPRKTHIMYMTSNEIEEFYRIGLYKEPDKELRPTVVVKKKSNSDDTQSMHASAREKPDTYEIHECHCWWDLDGDGYAEPYIVTLHPDSKQVLRIFPRFVEDSVLYTEDGRVSRITPDEYFTSYIFIPDPNSGVYGLGFGNLLGPLNHSLNTLINQLVAAGTLANTQGGFIAKNLKLKGGTHAFGPGEWRITNAYGDDIRKGIVPLPVNDPSSTLFSLLGLLESAGMKLASVADIMTGDMGGQNTKATVAMAAVEPGTNTVTVPFLISVPVTISCASRVIFTM